MNKMSQIERKAILGLKEELRKEIRASKKGVKTYIDIPTLTSYYDGRKDLADYVVKYLEVLLK